MSLCGVRTAPTTAAHLLRALSDFVREGPPRTCSFCARMSEHESVAHKKRMQRSKRGRGVANGDDESAGGSGGPTQDAPPRQAADREDVGAGAGTGEAGQSEQPPPPRKKRRRRKKKATKGGSNNAVAQAAAEGADGSSVSPRDAALQYLREWAKKQAGKPVEWKFKVRLAVCGLQPTTASAQLCGLACVCLQKKRQLWILKHLYDVEAVCGCKCCCSWAQAH